MVNYKTVCTHMTIFRMSWIVFKVCSQNDNDNKFYLRYLLFSSLYIIGCKHIHTHTHVSLAWICSRASQCALLNCFISWLLTLANFSLDTSPFFLVTCQAHCCSCVPRISVISRPKTIYIFIFVILFSDGHT